jgi:hypothetical protein
MRQSVGTVSTGDFWELLEENFGYHSIKTV